MDINKAKNSLAKLCSLKELCSKDAKDKLIKWGISIQDSNKIIKSLIDDKFIDDSRYATFYTRDKYRFNKWGRNKIKYALKLKNISSSDISDAMNHIDEKEYYKILTSVVKQKLNSTKEEDLYKLKSKILNYTLSKGYESSLTIEILESLKIFKN